MKQQRVVAAIGRLHRGHRRVRARGDDLETRGRRRDEVAVARPHAQIAWQLAKQTRRDCHHGRSPPQTRTRDAATARPRRREGRSSAACRSRCPAWAGRARAPPGSHFGASASDTLFGPPDRMRPDRLLRAHGLDRRVEREDLGIHRQLAQTASDQLRELRAEVENENRLVRHVNRTVRTLWGTPPVDYRSGAPTDVEERAGTAAGNVVRTCLTVDERYYKRVAMVRTTIYGAFRQCCEALGSVNRPIAIALLAVVPVIDVTLAAQAPPPPGDAAAPVRIVALDPRWTAAFESALAAPAGFDQDMAYVPLKSGELVALALDNGAETWRMPLAMTASPATGRRARVRQHRLVDHRARSAHRQRGLARRRRRPASWPGALGKRLGAGVH